MFFGHSPVNKGLCLAHCPALYCSKPIPNRSTYDDGVFNLSASISIYFKEFFRKPVCAHKEWDSDVGRERTDNDCHGVRLRACLMMNRSLLIEDESALNYMIIADYRMPYYSAYKKSSRIS